MTNAATTTRPACIANNGENGETEIPLWECPCRECTKMDWELARDMGDEPGTLKAWRQENFPTEWAS